MSAIDRPFYHFAHAARVMGIAPDRLRSLIDTGQMNVLIMPDGTERISAPLMERWMHEDAGRQAQALTRAMARWTDEGGRHATEDDERPARLSDTL